MNRNFFFIITLLLTIILGCSKEDPEITPVISIPDSTMSLNLISSNSYRAKFIYDYDSIFKNVKLVWNTSNKVDVYNNKIGIIDILKNDSNIIINNLKQNQTYFFRLSGYSNKKWFYSDIIPVTTGDFKITFNNQILNSIYTNGNGLKKIYREDDGFVLFTTELIGVDNTAIRVSKINNKLDLLWTFVVDETSDIDQLGGVFQLNNGEFIAFAKTFTYANNNEVYGFKFNNSGNIIWKNYYNSNNDAWFHSDLIIPFSSKSNDLKVVFKSDSTYSGYDDYFREINIKSNGEIISDKIIGSTKDYQFQNIFYDKFGNKYNYGSIIINPNNIVPTILGMLQKFDVNNNLILNNHFGNPPGSNYINCILTENDGKVTMIGKHAYEIPFQGNYRWILQTNETAGESIWSIKEHDFFYSYWAKDIMLDNDGLYLSLFFDIYETYDFATLIKTDKDGNIIWKFKDGDVYNQDDFMPIKVFREGNEYLIFGVKDATYLWLKKIIIE